MVTTRRIAALLLLGLLGGGGRVVEAESRDGAAKAWPDTAAPDSSDGEKARRRDPAHRARKLLDGAVSRANPLAAPGQTVDMVRWMAKRRQLEIAGVPYGITGLPLFYYSPNTG